MAANEGMIRRGEHEISPADNASNTRIDEQVTSPAIEPRTEECWIKEMEDKIIPKVCTYRPWHSSPFGDEREPKICMYALDKEFSQPMVVSIGPFHKVEGLAIVDEDKKSIVELMNGWYGLQSADSIKKMKNQIEDARKCYSDLDKCENFDSKDDKIFTEMLLLDSYFILFMLTLSDTFDRMIQTTSVAMPEFARHWKIINFYNTPTVFYIISHKHDIMLDLLIFNNQIPYFVIEELFKELKLKKPLHNYALEFFEMIHPRSTKGSEGHNRPPIHLLEIFHWSRTPEDQKDDLSISSSHHLGCPDWTRYTPSAVELGESTIILRKKTSGSLLDITFPRCSLMPIVRVLNIPELHFRDYSKFIFYNLIAFEMQCPHWRCCTMAFSTLMWNLLQSEKDVKLLRKCGILADASMTDNELVDFFKHLGQLIENYSMPINMYKVCHLVQSHHKHRMRRLCRSVILY